MSSDSDEAGGVDWEGAGRELLQRQAESVEQEVRDALRPLRQAGRDGGGVREGTAAELQTAVTRLESLAAIANTLDPSAGSIEDLDTVTDDGTNSPTVEGES